MDEEQIKRILRAQAWERAKGELKAMLATFFGEASTFEQLNSTVDEFVSIVERHGWQE